MDENLLVELKEMLCNAGHDAATVLDEGLGGGDDPGIMGACQREGRVLVTLDLDFSDIRTYRPSEHSGIIVLRLRRQDTPHVLSVVREMIPLIRSEPLKKHLWVVEEHRIRIRA